MSLILVAVLGYLTGSISFARIVVRLYSPDRSVQNIQLNIPGTDANYQSAAVSATAVNLQLGPRYGCLTSLLDMTKVGLPALLLKLYYPLSPYHLIFAAFGTLGHIWPVYYKFRGGRGMSTILAGFAIVDWLGVLISFSISLVVGLFRRDFYIANKLSIILMIPWLWFRTHNWTLLLFAVALNLMNLIAVIPEIKEVNRLRREGSLGDFLHAETVQINPDDGTGSLLRNTFYGEYQKLIQKLRDWRGKGLS